MSRSGVIISFVFALIVTIGVGIACVIEVTRIGTLHASSSWPTAQATIARADVVSYRAGKSGRKHRVDIVYTFQTPDGRTYTGNRFHSSEQGPGYRAKQAAEGLAARHAPGTTVTTYYNPDDPSYSLLWPGVTDDDRTQAGVHVMLVFLALGFWAMSFHLLRRRGPDHIAGVRILPGSPMRLRKSSVGALAGGLFFGAASALAVVLIGAANNGLSWVGLALVPAIGLAGTVMGMLLARAIARRGKRDLTLDLDNELLTTPDYSESPRVALAYATIADTAVRRVVRGSGKSRQTVYEVRLRTAGEGGRSVPGPTAMELSGRKHAEEFQTWLREQLALEGDGSFVDHEP